MAQDWRKNQNAAFAAVMMVRMTHDRSRDLAESVRNSVIEKLAAAKAPDLWQRIVSEYVELDEADSKRVFGEALPVGLKLLAGPERKR